MAAEVVVTVVIVVVAVVVVAVVVKSMNCIRFRHTIYLLVTYLLDKYNSLLRMKKFPHSCLFHKQGCRRIHHHCHSHPHLGHRAAKLCNMTMYPSLSNHKLL